MKIKKEYMIMGIVLMVLLIVGLVFDDWIVLGVSGIGNEIVDEFFIWFSYGGTWFVVLFIMTSLFLWNERKRKWILPLWISFGIAEGIAQGLKFIVDRARPYEVLEIMNLSNGIGSSFPSAHAAAVFSALAVLDKEFKRFRWFWLGIAVLVAFSRLYLGVHYLSDVVFGAFIGLGVGILVVGFWEKKFF